MIGGSGYNSSTDTCLHFALDKAATIDKIEVRWPSRLKEEFLNVPLDAIYEIKEEHGLRKLMSLPVPSRQPAPGEGAR